jgi:hypothetical protein
MITYQLLPSVVIGFDNQVYKIFKTSDLREKESDRMLKFTDDFVAMGEQDFAMRLVKVLGHYEKLLILQKAPGEELSDLLLKGSDHAMVIGRCLKMAHLNFSDSVDHHANALLGDFVISHLFVDSPNKLITYIDPGANFMVPGDQLEDVARFLFSVADEYRFRPFSAMSVMRKFLMGYNEKGPSCKSSTLAAVEVRKNRSICKYFLQKTKIRAVIGSLIIRYNAVLIACVVK